MTEQKIFTECGISRSLEKIDQQSEDSSSLFDEKKIPVETHHNEAYKVLAERAS